MDARRTVPHALVGSHPGHGQDVRHDAWCIPAMALVWDQARHNLLCHGIPADLWQRGKWRSAQRVPAVRSASLSIALCMAHPCTRHRAHRIPTHGTSPCMVHAYVTACPYAWHVTAAVPVASGRGCCCPGCFSNKNKGSARSPALAPSPPAARPGGPWRLPGLIHRALQASGLWCPSAWGPMGVPEPPTWPTTATHLQHGQPRLQEGDTNPACPGTIGISDISAAGGPAGTRHRPGQTPRHQPGTLLGRRTSWDWHAGATASPAGGSERHHGGQQASHEPGPRCRELLNKHPLFGRWFV